MQRARAFGRRAHQTTQQTNGENNRTFESGQMSLYHQLLGVQENATIEEIKEQYRLLCKKYHPDISNSETIEKMAFINEAYDNLVRKIKKNYVQSISTTEKTSNGIIQYRDQAYAFYKQGILNYREVDPGMTFHDSREQNKTQRIFANKENVLRFERSLLKSLYYLNIVCMEYSNSEWYDDSVSKIKEINRRRVMIKNWKERFMK
jgi:hypothetical protein